MSRGRIDYDDDYDDDEYHGDYFAYLLDKWGENAPHDRQTGFRDGNRHADQGSEALTYEKLAQRSEPYQLGYRDGYPLRPAAE